MGGGWRGVACLCGFGLSVMTVSKTVLYCEFFFFFLSREGCVVSFWFWGGRGVGGCSEEVEIIGYTRITWDDWETDESGSCSGLNEYFSDFENIGHNDFYSLLFLWIIPK